MYSCVHIFFILPHITLYIILQSIIILTLSLLDEEALFGQSESWIDNSNNTYNKTITSNTSSSISGGSSISMSGGGGGKSDRLPPGRLSVSRLTDANAAEPAKGKITGRNLSHI